MIKALVTGGGAVLGPGIIRALRRSKLDATIVVTDSVPLSAGLYWGDTACRVPLADDPSYVEAIGSLLKRERPDVVLVGTDVELAAFAAHRAALEAGFDSRIIVSAPEVVAIADDEFRTFEFLRDDGFDPPASARADDEPALEALLSKVGFPLVVKPRVGARSVGMSVVQNRQGLDDAIRGRSGLVVEECIGTSDTEYTASVLVFDGVAAASVVMRRNLREETPSALIPVPTTLSMPKFAGSERRLRRSGPPISSSGPTVRAGHACSRSTRVSRVRRRCARSSGSTRLNCA